MGVVVGRVELLVPVAGGVLVLATAGVVYRRQQVRRGGRDRRCGSRLQVNHRILPIFHIVKLLVAEVVQRKIGAGRITETATAVAVVVMVVVVMGRVHGPTFPRRKTQHSPHFRDSEKITYLLFLPGY